MPSASPLKVIIFGTTLSAYSALGKFLNDPRIQLLGFYDNDERKWGKKFMGLSIWPPAPKSECPADVVYIGSSYIEAISKQLQMLGHGGRLACNYEQLMSLLAKHHGTNEPPALPPTFNTQVFPKILHLAQNYGNQPAYEETQNASFDGTIAVTACANNQLSLAIVMARSFLKSHPQGRVIICIADLRDKRYVYPDDQDARIEVIEARALNIPEFQKFAFQYTIFELCCAIKAYALQYAIQKPGVRKLLYLDADGLVLAPFDQILELLDKHFIILTPHRLRAASKYVSEQERIMMYSGSYNAGFLAINACSEGHAFLDWWAQRLYRHCLLDAAGNYFVDQRWLSEVPAIFENVHIFREPGVNVAMWNAEDNPLTFSDNRFWVGKNKPLVFYHFSKVSLTDWSTLFHAWISPNAPTQELHLLVLLYRTLVLQTYSRPGNERSNTWAYGYFSNGVRIADSLRRLLHNKILWARWEDPFDTQSENSFWNWLNTPIAPDISLTNLFAYIDTPPDDPIDMLSTEYKANRALKQFMHGAKSANPYSIDLNFYRQVLNNCQNCTLLTQDCLKEIPQHFLSQL